MCRYHLKYDDGDEELTVSELRVRKGTEFAVGTLVQADYQAEGEFFDGKIAHVHGNGLYVMQTHIWLRFLCYACFAWDDFAVACVAAAFVKLAR